MHRHTKWEKRARLKRKTAGVHSTHVFFSLFIIIKEKKYNSFEKKSNPIRMGAHTLRTHIHMMMNNNNKASKTKKKKKRKKAKQKI